MGGFVIPVNQTSLMSRWRSLLCRQAHARWRRGLAIAARRVLDQQLSLTSRKWPSVILMCHLLLFAEAAARHGLGCGLMPRLTATGVCARKRASGSGKSSCSARWGHWSPVLLRGRRLTWPSAVCA